ncbi:MAG: penicillin-binding protein 2 [Anaerolineales bacterium]|nr:penicillin-binding protein 2 [Anaerolineales bacterium]
MSQKGWEFIDEPREEEEGESGYQGRLFFFRLLVVAVFGLLLYRVFWLPQTQGLQFTAQAEDNRFARLLIDPPRGSIFDRNGIPLAINNPSFNVTITPAFLPDDDAERTAVFQRLSLLTGIPVSNTLEQQALIDAADPELVSVYSRLALLYGESPSSTLSEAGVVPELPQSIEAIYEEFSFAQYIPTVITSGVPAELAYFIDQESTFLPGVRVIPEPIRYYPTDEYLSTIIGYMGPIPNESWLDRGYERDDRVGLAGLELWMEEELSGTKGYRDIEQDWTGREVRQIGETVEPVPGYDVHLTIDFELQRRAQNILESTMERRRLIPQRDYITGEESLIEVEQGAIVALNPNTGEILALVSLPTYSNERFNESAPLLPIDYYLGLARNEYTPLVNHAVGGQYPPGSVFKIVTAAAAMEEGIISPQRLLAAPGSIEIPNRFAPNDPGRNQRFVCWIDAQGGTHEFVNMLSAIAFSCDIYFYKISGGFNQDGETVSGVGVDTLKVYAEMFGFNRNQGVEQPGEAPGFMPSTQWIRTAEGRPWATGDDYNLGIGQGFLTATPLQIAQMAAVIANGGFLYQPTLVHHLTDATGEVVQEFEPRILNVVDVNQEFLDVIAQGMLRVNEPDYGTAGTVGWLDEYGIAVAGKTGTAEYCDNIAQSRGWCIEGRVLPTHAWYVGYAPYDDPEIVVAAFIFNGGEGSAWAAPAVRDVMLAYFEVGPYAPLSEPEFEPANGSTDTP